MFGVFEPAEKKLELRLRAGCPSLRALPSSFWDEVVRSARAEIITRREVGRAFSFLLSESSLFVFDQRLVMITCGRSTLVESARHLVDAIGLDSIESASFQRRTEQTTGPQHSRFEADAGALGRLLPGGTTTTLGSNPSTRLQRFEYESPTKRAGAESSLELYMYEVAEPEPALGDLLSGFQCDEHRFEPEGHSLNAVAAEGHRAIHVSPSPTGIYAGMDASDERPFEIDRLLDLSLSRFRPRRWEAVLRRPGEPAELVERAIESRVSYL